MQFTELPAYQPFALFTVLLILKMGAVAFVTANIRRKVQIVVNTEDTLVNPGSHVEPAEHPDVARAKRAHINDLENIPPFLFLALLYTLAGGTSRGAWIYFGLYFAVRTLHTVFYLNQKQPFRTLMFAIGQLAQVGLMVQILMRAFRT